MQGNELMPGGKNILLGCPDPRAPHRGGRDPTLNPLKNLRKSGFRQIGPHPFGLLGSVRRVVMIVGEGRDDAGAEFVGLGMGQLERCDLLEVAMQNPGMVDETLQDQRLPAGQRAALTTHDRACRELRTGRLVRPSERGAKTLWTAAPGIEPAGILPAPGGKTPG